MNQTTTDHQAADRGEADLHVPASGQELSALDLAIALVSHWRLVFLGSVAAGLVALGIAFIVPPTFTARTVFLPPQQQQSIAASALASLGALSSLAGAATGIRSPADQYVSLMQSSNVTDRIIDKFKLLDVYDEEYRVDARKELAKNVRIVAGKKDGLISIEVDDKDPKRAAEMANMHIDELRRLTALLALTEAQQRRVFFEAQLAQTRDRLTKAQQILQSSGFNPGALKAEPKAAADGYARLRAEVTSAEVRLQGLRRSLADTAPEVQQQVAVLMALRNELAKQETATDTSNDPGYVGRYREFKYQETLFDLFSRQYELARLDESREGSLIQIVDIATPPEKKAKPRRLMIAAISAAMAFLALAAFVIFRHVSLHAERDPETARKLSGLRSALGRS